MINFIIIFNIIIAKLPKSKTKTPIYLDSAKLNKIALLLQQKPNSKNNNAKYFFKN
jgi:hypothetical protein